MHVSQWGQKLFKNVIILHTMKLWVEMDFRAAHTHVRTLLFNSTCANLTKFNCTPIRTFCMQNSSSYFLEFYFGNLHHISVFDYKHIWINKQTTLKKFAKTSKCVIPHRTPQKVHITHTFQIACRKHITYVQVCENLISQITVWLLSINVNDLKKLKSQPIWS